MSVSRSSMGGIVAALGRSEKDVTNSVPDRPSRWLAVREEGIRTREVALRLVECRPRERRRCREVGSAAQTASCTN